MRVLVRLLLPFAALAAGAVGVALHLGCHSSAPPPGPAAVRGRVTFQGRPVAGGLVVFAPDRDRGMSGRPLHGETGPDGTFQLHAADGSTVPPGWYRVAIAPPPSADPTAAPAFPPQLRRPERSGLVREVTAGKDHFFEFAVEVPNG